MTDRLHLPQVTLIAITDRDHGKTIEALLKTLKLIQPLRTILFSDVYLENQDFECILIDPLRSAQKYNEFVTWKLGHYIHSGHILLVQYDGYVLDASAWTDEFLDFDYIGAPWAYTDGRNVGNGGFSLRSARLHKILASDPFITVGSPEDEIICRLFRGYLETHHKIKYAPEELAHRFSFEMQRPLQKTFGFHNFFHPPYKEPVIIRRSYAMGDVIMAEPVMEYFFQKGYRVILDSDPKFYNLFYQHYFPIEHLSRLKEDWSGYRIIDLDMAYEVQPRRLVLEAYFTCAGVKDYTLKNPKLNFGKSKETKLFNKYAIIHINQTDMPYRNIHEVIWSLIVGDLECQGYDVFQVGGGPDVATRINTHSENMLAYIVAGADIFIGSDSGIAHIAVSCGVPSVIFFGSVDPKLRYPNLDNITVVQETCDHPGCYHDLISERGMDCRFDVKRPPCTRYRTDDVINKINKLCLSTT